MDCWDDKLEKMQDDCLQSVRMVCIDVVMNKYVQILTYIFLFFHVPLWALQFYFITLDGKLILQYGPSSLVFFFAFISIGIAIVYQDTVKASQDDIRATSWSLSAVSQELQQDILKKAHYLTYIMMVNFLLGAITLIFMLMRPIARPNWEVFYQVTLLQQHFPLYGHILSWIFLVSMCYILVFMLQPVYLLAYVCLQMHFQVKMLNERFRRITEGFPDDVIVSCDQVYHKQVFDRLRFCFDRGIEILKFRDNYTKHAAPATVAYIILSMCLSVTCVSILYIDPDLYYPLILSLCVTCGYSGLVAVEIGQIIEQEHMSTYEILMSLPWYNFTVSNQKFVHFVSIHAGKSFSLTGYESLPLNRTLIVQFYKIISSLSAVMASRL